MALDADVRWDQYEIVNVDLSDMMGTPMLGSGDDFAERVAAAPGVSTARNLGGENDPFIVAETTEAANVAPIAALGFLAADSGFLDADESADEPAAAKVIWRTTTHSGTHTVARQEVRGVELVGCRFSVHHRPGS